MIIRNFSFVSCSAKPRHIDFKLLHKYHERHEALSDGATLRRLLSNASRVKQTSLENLIGLEVLGEFQSEASGDRRREFLHARIS
jgi:hypothetical protein